MSDESPREVLVVGAGVAGLAAAWALRKSGARVVVIERGERLGGLIETEHPAEGVTIEHGADALLSGKPGGLPVLRALGLEQGLTRSGRAPRRAFVLTDEGLLPMPGGLFAFERRALVTMLTSPLLSPTAKLRLSAEPLIARGTNVDESVASFFERRLGPEVTRRLVAPMVRGIYGASASEVSIRAAFPALAGFEDRYGSVGLALAVAPRAPRGAGLVTPSEGMAEIPKRLFGMSGARIVFGQAVRSIEPGTRSVRVRLSDGTTHEPDAVVVATDVSTAAALLAPVDSVVGDLLGVVRSTDAEVVTLAFERRAVEHPLDGTGFVVSRADRSTVACTFASEKWHGRAPEGLAIFRSVLGASPDASEADLVERAVTELESAVGLRGPPLWTRVRRRAQALPTYAVGHRARIERVLEGVRAVGRVSVAGNYLFGVGVPDAIASGLAATENLHP